MAQTHDVVIVGGGIAGCSLAYALSLRGVKSVIVERDEIATHASGAAAGLLTPSSEISEPGPLFDFAMEALRRHRLLAERLKEEVDADVLYSRQPVLRLAFTNKEESALAVQSAWQEGLRWVDRRELANLEPFANPAALGAAYSEHEARVNSRRLTRALADAAIKRGAAVAKGRVASVETSGNRLTGLMLDGGELVCGDVFVFAMGSWAPDAEPWLRVPLPVAPLRGQILELHSPQVPRHAIFSNGNYLAPQSDGSIVAGTTEEWAGFESRVTPVGQASILEKIKKMAPVLSDAKIAGSRAGLRPVSRDNLPIAGPAPGWQNVFISTGGGRKGILLGPMIGECLAGLILDRNIHNPLRIFDPGRFAASEAQLS